MSVSHMRGYGKFTWTNEVHFRGVRWESNTTGVFNLQLGPKKRTSAEERRGKKSPKNASRRGGQHITVKNVVGFLQNVPRWIVESGLCFKNISQIIWPGTSGGETSVHMLGRGAVNLEILLEMGTCKHLGTQITSGVHAAKSKITSITSLCVGGQNYDWWQIKLLHLRRVEIWSANRCGEAKSQKRLTLSGDMLGTNLSLPGRSFTSRAHSAVLKQSGLSVPDTCLTEHRAECTNAFKMQLAFFPQTHACTWFLKGWNSASIWILY